MHYDKIFVKVNLFQSSNLKTVATEYNKKVLYYRNDGGGRSWEGHFGGGSVGTLYTWNPIINSIINHGD